LFYSFAVNPESSAIRIPLPWGKPEKRMPYFIFPLKTFKHILFFYKSNKIQGQPSCDDAGK
jgi:hypothetical protein